MTTTRKGYKDPRATYGDFQDYKYPTDAPALDADLFNRIASLLADTVAKGAPRAQDTPDMTVYVSAFQAYISGSLVSFAGGNSGSMSAPSANPRIDRVYLTSAGALAITTGAEAASPTAPALVVNTVPICLVYHRVGSVHIDDADDSTNSYIYRDDRPLFQGVARSPTIVGPVEVSHDGGASQAICTTPAFCDIMIVAVKCTQATDTSTVELGWSGDTDTLMTDDEFPKTLNATQVMRFPTDPLTAAKDIIATVGGAGTVGEWDISVVYANFT